MTPALRLFGTLRGGQTTRGTVGIKLWGGGIGTIRRRELLRLLPAITAMAQTPIDDPYAYHKLSLRRAGVAVDNEAAWIKTLRQREKPWLAVYAAHFLGKLPKSELAIRELNAAARSEHEFLSLAATESLTGWGDRQWVSAARSRLPSYKDQGVRLGVAALLARAGVFDGWNMIESTIMSRDGRYRGIALLHVSAFRDMKELSGQPFDLVKKLDSMRSSSSSKAVRDALWNKIIQLTPQPPVQGLPRE